MNTLAPTPVFLGSFHRFEGISDPSVTFKQAKEEEELKRGLPVVIKDIIPATGNMKKLLESIFKSHKKNVEKGIVTDKPAIDVVEEAIDVVPIEMGERLDEAVDVIREERPEVTEAKELQQMIIDIDRQIHEAEEEEIEPTIEDIIEAPLPIKKEFESMEEIKESVEKLRFKPESDFIAIAKRAETEKKLIKTMDLTNLSYEDMVSMFTEAQLGKALLIRDDQSGKIVKGVIILAGKKPKDFVKKKGRDSIRGKMRTFMMSHLSKYKKTL
ncbi:MAG TPA: hypothetical protein ENG48_12355 [Candidatus Atribacteria bacterium]|nr:hypothetical protein [Candidatus Atribacteria bacterium]